MRNKYLFAVAALSLVACGEKEKSFDASGIFETTETVVSAKASGEIMSLAVEEGSDVTAGEELGYIDMEQLRLQKQQLRSTRQATGSRKLDNARQVASLRQQIANLERERARFESLLRDGAATRKQVDDIGYQISVLQKQIDAASEQVTTSNESLEKQSEGIDAQIGQVDDRMRNALIVSPVSGTVLVKYAEKGEFATPGKPLFKVADMKDMKLRAYISADQLTSLRLGQQVSVYADSGKDGRRKYSGTVIWISDKAEFTPKTIQTRDERSNLVYAIKISIRNDGLIKRGMYGDVNFK